jgi:hypothetical protein
VRPRVYFFQQKHTLSFWLTAFFFPLLLLSSNISACQCGSPGPTSCQAIGPSSTVFLGVVDSIEIPSYFDFLKVVSLRSPSSFREQYWEFADNVTVVFTVEEWFSGKPQKTVGLHIRKFLGACGYEYHPDDLFFHKGERYLVYAGENNGILATNHCSKTRHARDKNDAEIENLRRLHLLSASIVTGTYAIPAVYGPNAPIGGANVSLTSSTGQRFTSSTDANGVFTFSGLPSATYQIQLDTPPGFVVDWAPKSGAYSFTSEGIVPANSRELVVHPDACRDASYTALPDGRISGVATSRRGKLQEPIRIRVWPANHVDAIGNSWWAQYETGPAGTFHIGPLLPGRYVIAAYLYPPDFMERSKNVNYALNFVPQPWFYPGTTDPEKAKAITVGFARQVSGIHFVVPPASVKTAVKQKTDRQ